MHESSARTIAHTPIEMRWSDGLVFEIGRTNGPRARIDGDGHTAPTPFDMLIGAIATCASVDVLTILAKQRTPVRALTVRIDAQRLDATPRRLAAAILHFSITAPGSTTEKASRAVELAVSKYCSVRSSLIADAEVTWTVELTA